MNVKPIVYLALSGGVDSAVAAVLLLEQGYDVRGIFLKIWSDDLEEIGHCPWVQDRRDAIKVAAKLGIPFETVNFEKEYEDEVFSYFLEEYRAGRTPNPDILCNTVIKFGAFIQYARSHGADYIATGHHARRSPSAGNDAGRGYRLLKGKDLKKDQSYFLAGLTQEQLHYSLFPIGDYTKEEVRQIAADHGLDMVENKRSTRGICFVGKVDLKQFMDKYADQKPGDIVDVNGKVLGKHKGIMAYTIGQRKRIEIDAKSSNEVPFFVIAKDAEKNVIIVSQNEEDLMKMELISAKNHWISGNEHKLPLTKQAKIRYNQEVQDVTISKDPSSFAQDPQYMVTFAKAQRAIAPGQIIAYYDEDALIGSGTII